MKRETRRIRHGRLGLALHRLQSDCDRASALESPILLLHELGSRSPEEIPNELGSWPGEVWALDMTGHGESDHPTGGGYTIETLAGDVDAALAEIGPATVMGAGLGAFLALLSAGFRPSLVQGAILLPGAGLEGGGPEPVGLAPVVDLSPEIRRLAESAGTDPFALAELSHDVRPPGWAALFVRQARHLSGLDVPIAVCLEPPHPPWLERVVGEKGVMTTSLDRALAAFTRTG